MKYQFTAVIEPGEKYLIGSCPEVPEANGQGLTREECLKDLEASIQSVLEFKRDEGLAHIPPQAEKTTLTSE